MHLHTSLVHVCRAPNAEITIADSSVREEFREEKNSTRLIEEDYMDDDDVMNEPVSVRDFNHRFQVGVLSS